MSWNINFLKRKPVSPNKVNTFYIEEMDEITDEIEKSLLEIKDKLDLPTEEIELAIKSRREIRKNSS
jgi:hypothetical protein